MTDNKREAAAYIRVSTDEQREFSPESQLDRILSYAESHGYSIKKENIFCDNGISGKSTEKREGFKSMIEKAKNKPTPLKQFLFGNFQDLPETVRTAYFINQCSEKNTVSG